MNQGIEMNKVSTEKEGKGKDETLVCSLKSGTCLGMRDNSGM